MTYIHYGKQRKCRRALPQVLLRLWLIPALFTDQHQFTGEVTCLSYRAVHKNWIELIKPALELKGIRLYDLAKPP